MDEFTMPCPKKVMHDKKVPLTNCSIIMGELGFLIVIGINQICVFYSLLMAVYTSKFRL
uniref:Uncharacterized protein n=3 Tax=Oryza TaxID=4527 RepID=A0A0D3G417_9ORYZ